MSLVFKPLVRLPKNSHLSDFECVRKDHIHKQIDFTMRQVTNILETKLELESNSIVIKIVEETGKEK